MAIMYLSKENFTCPIKADNAQTTQFNSPYCANTIVNNMKPDINSFETV